MQVNIRVILGISELSTEPLGQRVEVCWVWYEIAIKDRKIRLFTGMF